MRTKLAVAAAVALLVLAGCTGSLSGGGPTLDDVEYPPGVSDAGVNATALADAHHTALENHSFTLAANFSGSTVVRSAAEADLDRLLVHLNTTDRKTALYYTKNTVYVRDASESVRYDVHERTGLDTPMSPYGTGVLLHHLTSANFTPSGVTTENGTTLIVLTADALPRMESAGYNVTQFDGRVLVDERGVVHRIDVEFDFTDPDGDTTAGSTTIRVTDIGKTDVPEPDWLDEAKAKDDDTD